MTRTQSPPRDPPPFAFTPPPVVRPRRPVRRLLRLLVAGTIWLVLALVAAFFGFMTAMAQELPRLDPSRLHPKANGVIYAGDGHTVLALLRSDENRRLVPSDQIAPVMKHALVAIEDRRFYEHGAIDPIGLARAALVDAEGGRTQGGSTITQQFIKNTLTGAERSLRRKIVEAALAYQLERRWSKDRILTQYLNTVFFGHHAYGVETAAQVYFGRHARSLAAWQAALLAGLVRAPSTYDPVTHPRLARARRNLVLARMLEQGYLDPTSYAIAREKPLLPRGRRVALPARTRGIAAYFTQSVIDQLVARFGADKTFGGGLRVQTTIDLREQAEARRAVERTLRGVGPSGALVAIDPRTGQVKAEVGGGDFSRSEFNLATQARRQPGSAFKPFVLLAALARGIQPETRFESRPQLIRIGASVWRVANDEDSYLGSIPLSTATTYSDNAVYAQLTVLLGPSRVRDMAHRLGVVSPIDAVPAIGLGGLRVGVSPLELAHAYATIANEGVRVGGSIRFRPLVAGESADPSLDPISITRVEDAEGHVWVNRPRRVRVVSRDDALETLAILKTVLRSGTASRSLGSFPRPAAGKTGTTSNFVDAWFAGATPQLATAVWVGYTSGNREMRTEFHGKPVFGGTYPALIWRAFMTPALAGQPALEWPAPARPWMAAVRIDPVTGLRASGSCRRAHDLVLAVDRIPSGWSSCSGSYTSAPELVGVTRRRALRLLDDALLRAQVVFRAARPGDRPGTVVQQQPQAGQPVLNGGRVRLVVARDVVEVVLPDLRGETRDRAVSELRTAGFRVSVAGGAPAGAVPRVLQQLPGPGLRPRGTAVRLAVGSAPRGAGG